jgi:hypothetical protein
MTHALEAPELARSVDPGAKQIATGMTPVEVSPARCCAACTHAEIDAATYLTTPPKMRCWKNMMPTCKRGTCGAFRPGTPFTRLV